MTDIRERLLAARLPAMPQVLLRLLELCRRNDAGFVEFAAAIARDAGIAGRILGVAHSAAYRRSERRLNLEQALVALGTNTIRSLVIGESVAQVFRHFAEQHPVDLAPFWRHSLTTAVIARELAVATAYPQVEEAYLAGLLHDIGRLAMLSACPKEYAAFFAGPDDDASCEQERQALQIAHTEVGAWIVERWKLDSFVADSTLYHHQPVDQLQGAAALVKLLFLANRLAENAVDSPAVGEAAPLLDLPAGALAAIAERAGPLVAEAAEQLGIDLPPAAAADDCQARLAEAVGDIVAAAEAARPLLLEHDAQRRLLALVRAACILFDAGDAAALLCDPQRNALCGVSADPRQQRLAEIALPLTPGTPVADAALGREPTFFTIEGATVGEAQLLRLLDTEAAACLPLIGSRRTLGVLVCALDRAQLARLQPRSGLLQAFAAHAASALEAAEGQVAAPHDERPDAASAARRMVHEANNPLAIIRNYLSVLDRKLRNQQPVGSEIGILNEEIDRVGNILQAFARGTPIAAEPQTTDLSQVLRDVVALFEKSGFASDAMRIRARVAATPLPIRADRNTLRQILINLVKNAVEAMSGGGEITLAGSGPVNFGGELFVELSVSDTGPGIPQALLGKLFVPLTSTKNGENRGLGLSIVKELVDRLGGRIFCSSGESGTRFTILLPAGGAPQPAT